MPIFRGKNFVSSASDYKDSVRAATRTNINLSSNISSIDGVTLADEDRVLVMGQSNQVQNGIYAWSAATERLTRTRDADSATELTSGVKIYVEEGSTYARTTWTLITQGTITPGVTSLTFSKESRVSQVDVSGTYGGSDKTLEFSLDETGAINSITQHNIALALDALTDVNTSGVADNYFLTYDSASSTWVVEQGLTDGTLIDGGNLDGESGGSGITTITDVHYLDDLVDVDTTTTAPTNGQALVWDSATSKWKPGSVAGGGAGGLSVDMGTFAEPVALSLDFGTF